MNFITITDNANWRFSLINLYALHHLRLTYSYYIYTTTEYAKECILDTLAKHTELYNYGHIYVNTIPSFSQTFNIDVTSTNHEWISIATLDRLGLPFHTDVKRFIWLDTDTLIVDADIINLYNTVTSDKGIAAIPTDTLLHNHIINFSNNPNLLSLAESNSSTFNAGVCVFDLNKFNKDTYTQFIKEIYERSNGDYVNDELILNLYDQKFNALPVKYNCFAYHKFVPTKHVVVHFSGADWKPWNKHLYTEGPYYKYYKLWEYYYALLFS